ncbi:MAG TPA: glycoside hydrolase family 57 protein [Terriglobales bacterium]|nr:glycoside hydrolase family 57 protein [Terriglobales bacterium]
MIRVAILWHMHQPLYRNPISGVYALPWTRLHALKDYYGMVRLTEEFPALRLTFNLVPSLIVQIRDYAEGRARDPFFDAAAAEAESLDPSGREFLLRYFFQAHPDTMIGRYPRYAELYAKFRQDNRDPRHGARHFSAAELRDLQVLNQLAWVDEFWLAEEPARTLAQKGREFTREDQLALCAAQRGWLAAVLPEYQKARERGQIEISTTPFYHPILPLLCDTNVALEAQPGLPLPREPFRFPQDAREQLLRARRLHAEVFGAEPKGLWPSEGAVSAAVAELAAEAGFQWMASDEGVLAKSLGAPLSRDGRGAAGSELLYAGYRLETQHGPLACFFRDHRLSDLIGFVYSRLEPEQAADDFVRRILANTAPLAHAGKDALVAVILDGENAWEYFTLSGRAFLRALYRRLTTTPGLATCTFAEAAALPLRPLPRLAAGSWIDANFNIWIGAEEDNRSWDLLRAARQTLAEHQAANKNGGYRDAYDDLLAAEGSDWNWWYGPQHHSENAAEFDALYRSLLSDVYAHLGRTPPASLAQPVARELASGAEFQAASDWIEPVIDGRDTSYFEWMGAAVYRADPRTGSMHGKQFRFSELRAGFNGEAVFLRLDFTSLPQDLEGELHCEFSSVSDHGLVLGIEGGRITRCQLDGGDAPDIQAVLHNLLEVRIPRARLDLAATPSHLRLRVGYWAGGLPTEMLPAEGSLEVILQEREAMQSY